METRDYYKYHIRVGHRIVHRGITNDLEHALNEHRQTWPDATIRQVGRCATRKAALEWERSRGRRRGSRS